MHALSSMIAFPEAEKNGLDYANHEMVSLFNGGLANALTTYLARFHSIAKAGARTAICSSNEFWTKCTLVTINSLTLAGDLRFPKHSYILW